MLARLLRPKSAFLSPGRGFLTLSLCFVLLFLSLDFSCKDSGFQTMIRDGIWSLMIRIADNPSGRVKFSQVPSNFFCALEASGSAVLFSSELEVAETTVVFVLTRHEV